MDSDHPHNHPMSSSRTAIIGFADALSAPEVAFSLLDAGFRVVAFFRRNSKRPALRKCNAVELVEVTPPEEDAERTVADLSGIYKFIQPVAIMPLNDKAVWLCEKLAADEAISVAGPTGMAARFSLDKRLQISAACNAGFGVPKTTTLETAEDALRVTEFPVVLKPALAVTEDHNRLLEKKSLNYCANPLELRKVIQSWSGKQPLMAQAVHGGVGEGLFGFASDSGIIALSAHRRVRMMNPKGSGASACKAMSVADYPVRNAEDMLLKIGWRGIFMIELLRDESGKPWFVELNGRPWGSMALARRMGFEYPAWAIMQILHPTFAPVPPAPCEYVTCRHLGRELIHILQVIRGPSSKAVPNWPPLWRTLTEMMKGHENDRWYNWNPANKSLFLADTVDTVMNETLRKFLSGAGKSC